MKEEQKIYIQGNSKRGTEIIKTLINLGGSNPGRFCHGIDEEAYYFINPNGIITKTYLGGVMYPFIKEFYREVKLPNGRLF